MHGVNDHHVGGEALEYIAGVAVQQGHPGDGLHRCGVALSGRGG